MKWRYKNRFLIFGFVLLCVLCGISLYQSKYALEVSEYQISSPKISEEFRVVQLTDLHNSRFGEANQRLVEVVKNQEPDLILVTGDMVNQEEADAAIAVNLMESLCGIAPVYFSLGNHEIAYMQNWTENLIEKLEMAGVHVLDQSYEEMEVHGQRIRLGGFYGYGLPEKYLKTKEASPEECEFLAAFQDTELYTVLMCHMPVCWMLNDGINEWDIDSVFAGHAHGGEVILPVIGGVYAPDMEWFPGRLEGLYYSKDESKVMVLSRGLGTSGRIPRFNNIPEVVVVDFVPARQ